MHNTNPPKNPIYLVHRKYGVIYTFKNFDQLVDQWRSIAHLSIGTTFSVKYSQYWPHDKCRVADGWLYSYILRDSYGNVIDLEEISLELRFRRWLRMQRCGRYHRVNDPQPGSKRTPYRYFRRIRTTHERRWAHAWDDEEFAPKVRAKRNFRNIPNSWEDYRRSDIINKNWKRFRKHQWKDK